MSDISGCGGLFPWHNNTDAETATNVFEARKTGVLPYQRLLVMHRAGYIKSVLPVEENQFQPASLDLRLEPKAFKVPASFLPGPKSTVIDRVKDLGGIPIDLENGAVLERGAVYVVQLQESVRLSWDIVGVANPKSSTGRLDILTRLTTDYATSFDRVERLYEGPLFIEIAPLSFSIFARAGSRLNQIRFQRERGAGNVALWNKQVNDFYQHGQLVTLATPPLPLRDGSLVPVTVDLTGSGSGSVVGYKALKTGLAIDLANLKHYDPKDFWQPIYSHNGRLNLDRGEFYILATKEDVGVPPQLAAEMVPYDTRSGEFRVHYAGFFDPGFGWEDGKAIGSKAVLEVRSVGVPFTLEHGQIVGWLRYAPIASGFTDKLYGTGGLSSNYQGQGVALAKHFKKWSSLDLHTPASAPPFEPFSLN